MPDTSLDPVTGLPWPAWPDTDTATRYLLVVHGLPITARTLANLRGTDLGPSWRYIGQKPVTTPAELDRYSLAALTDESPRKRRRLAREAAA